MSLDLRDVGVGDINLYVECIHGPRVSVYREDT